MILKGQVTQKVLHLTERQIIVVNKSNIQTIEFSISGMTCSDCEKPVTIAYNIIEVVVSTLLSYSDQILTLLGFGIDRFVEVVFGISIAHVYVVQPN